VHSNALCHTDIYTSLGTKNPRFWDWIKTLKINMSPEKGTISAGNCIFQAAFFRGHVSLQGGYPDGAGFQQKNHRILKSETSRNVNFYQLDDEPKS